MLHIYLFIFEPEVGVVETVNVNHATMPSETGQGEKKRHFNSKQPFSKLASFYKTMSFNQGTMALLYPSKRIF